MVIAASFAFLQTALLGVVVELVGRYLALGGMKMFDVRFLMLAGLTLFLLAACGGGGGSDGAAAPLATDAAVAKVSAPSVDATVVPPLATSVGEPGDGAAATVEPAEEPTPGVSVVNSMDGTPGESAEELVARLVGVLGLDDASRAPEVEPAGMVMTQADAVGGGEALSEAMPAPASAPVPPLSVGSVGGGFPPEAGGLKNPNEEPFPLMYFEGHGVNPFVDADEDALSTFALDGDTASFELGRMYLESGHLPEPDSVRVEEWVNAVDGGYRSEQRGLGLRLDGMVSPFGGEGYRLLRVGIASERPEGERDPVSLIFVLDVSGSMGADDRIGVAKLVMVGLAERVGPTDRVALVTYGERGRVVYPMTGGESVDGLVGVAREIQPEGSTYLAEGVELAYGLAADEVAEGRKVRIVILSDGVGNIGATGPETVLDLIEGGTVRDVAVTAVGVGSTGNYNDVMLEALANRGNGTYHYLGSRESVGDFLLNNAETVFREVARDARVQVEFNPDVVRKYRLIGYENRAVADQDFRDDTLDFGEVGFARDVTALYELRLEGDADVESWAARVYLRWNDVVAGEVKEVDQEATVGGVSVPTANASGHLVRAAAVAEFAELLRKSYWAQCSDLDAVAELLGDVELGDGGVEQLRMMLVQAADFEPYCKT